MREKALTRIDFILPGTSRYQVLYHFTEKLYEAFIRAGYSCRLFEMHDSWKVAKNPPDLTVGFNGVPRNASEEMLCDAFRIPYLTCLVDPPYHFFYLLKSPFVTICCDDRACCRFLKTLGKEFSIFLPHAVEPELLEEKREEPCFDLVMLATFIDYEKRRLEWRDKYPKVVHKAMDSAIEMAFGDPLLSHIDAFEEIFQRLPEKSFKGVKLYKVLEDLELYLKGKDRVELVKAIKEQPLHIFGGSVDEKGWKDYFSKETPIKFHAALNYEQAIQIMKRSKILLNPSLKNKEGAHERVFTGLACGALVVTNESQYLRERFVEGEDLVYYSHPHLDTINEAITLYLTDEGKRQELVRKGCAKTLKGETWDHRVITLEKEFPILIRYTQSN